MTTPPRQQDRPAVASPHSPGMDHSITEALLRTRRFFRKKEVSEDLRTLHQIGGRNADTF